MHSVSIFSGNFSVIFSSLSLILFYVNYFHFPDGLFYVNSSYYSFGLI